MKTSPFLRVLAPLIAGALLLPTSARAQTSYTATGWVNAVLAPGIWATNALGQVLARGIVQTARVLSPDPRVAGQVFIIADGSLNADGTANIQGPAYLQVGTWDPAGTNFTPSGGMWNLSWRGVMQTNYSFQLTQAGYGIGGSIDGLRLEQTLTRGPAANPLDPTVPYLYAGTIKPAPLNTSEVLDNFDDTIVTGWLPAVSDRGSGGATEANQQFTVWGSFPGVVTHSFFDSYSFQVLGSPWSVGEGETHEARVDLIGFNNEGTMPLIELGSTSGFYALGQGRAFIAIVKWSPANGFSALACETAQVKQTDVILSLALTRVSQNLIVTARVFDKTQAGVLLYERSVVDTPQADPSLTVDEFAALSGMRMTADFNPDVAGAPFILVRPGIGLVQNNDGTKQRAEATFDNLELRKYEIPTVGIARAVRLSWPAPAGLNYAVEGAPTVNGPWLPVPDLTIPGIQQVTVPASRPAQFFRLIQAP